MSYNYYKCPPEIKITLGLEATVLEEFLTVLIKEQASSLKGMPSWALRSRQQIQAYNWSKSTSYHVDPTLMERSTGFSWGSFCRPCDSAGDNTVILYPGFIYLPGGVSRGKKKETFED